jgi:hypothetical protein
MSPFVIVVPIIVFLALGAALAFGLIWYTTLTATLTAERDSLQRYIDSSRVNDSQEKAQAARAEADLMKSRANEVKDTLYNLSSYPDLYGEHFYIIFGFAGADIELSEYVYDRRTGVLSFSATSPSVRRMPYFIQSLRECGTFSDIQYRGYVQGTRTEDGAPVTSPLTDITTIPTIEVIEYRYEITCKLVDPTPSLPPVETDGDAGGDGTGDDGTAPREEGDE